MPESAESYAKQMQTFTALRSPWQVAGQCRYLLLRLRWRRFRLRVLCILAKLQTTLLD